MTLLNLSFIRKSRLADLLDQVFVLQKDIKNAIQFVKSIENKIWDVKYSTNESESANELAKCLLKLRANLVEFSKVEEERNWVAVGLAKVNDILRSATSIDQLAEMITLNLINYLSANQGALFILNTITPNNPFLEMKGL